MISSLLAKYLELSLLPIAAAAAAAAVVVVVEVLFVEAGTFSSDSGRVDAALLAAEMMTFSLY